MNIECRDVTKRFDDLTALDRVSLVVHAGEVHGLLGENGAGKTTLSNIMSGLYRADEGTVLLGGTPTRFTSPRQALLAGVGMVHQHFKLVETLTAAENLFLGWDECPRRVPPKHLFRLGSELGRAYGIDVDPQAYVWQLTVGEQQRLEILRVLARGATVLILDEPTAVLTEAESARLFSMLRQLADEGKAVIFISHKLRHVFSVCDRITVLRGGRHIGTAPTSELDVPTVAEMMTGSDRPEAHFEPTEVHGPPVITLEEVHCSNSRALPAVKGVSLDVRSGEVVGVAGVSGNGQTELAALATGLAKPSAGRVLVGGQDLTGKGPRMFRDAGVGHIAEDRVNTALVQSASVRDNTVICHYRSQLLSDGWRLKHRQIRSFARQLLDAGRVQYRSTSAPVSQLSGGNQQRLVSTREAMLAERALVAVHPSRGLDPGAVGAVHRTVRDQAQQGKAVLYFSDDLDELLTVSDRLVVMYDGRISRSYNRSEADRRTIGRLMAGLTVHKEPR